MKEVLREEFEATGKFVNDRLWDTEGRKEGLLKMGRVGSNFVTCRTVCAQGPR